MIIDVAEGGSVIFTGRIGNDDNGISDSIHLFDGGPLTLNGSLIRGKGAALTIGEDSMRTPLTTTYIPEPAPLLSLSIAALGMLMRTMRRRHAPAAVIGARRHPNEPSPGVFYATQSWKDRPTVHVQATTARPMRFA